MRRLLLRYPFPLDAFQQVAACAALLGESSFVFAHTSAGKSLVAELYIHVALRGSRSCVGGHHRKAGQTPARAPPSDGRGLSPARSLCGETATTETERTGAARPRVLFLSPLKALSNQKFRELRALWGDAAVGLLTGDEERNLHGQRGAVVATPEIVRNDLLRRG